MATDLTLPLPSAPAPKGADDSLGIDRAFVLSMARVPVLAAAWVAVAWLADQAFRQFAPAEYAGFGPLAVLCAGMVLAAVIDGWAFKVPNWLTLSLVVSGWYIGILHDCGVNLVPGFAPEATGGVGSALLGTALGFALLFPMLFIQGMGQGDVKMQMGFGSWVGAYFGFNLGASPKHEQPLPVLPKVTKPKPEYTYMSVSGASGVTWYRYLKLPNGESRLVGAVKPGDEEPEEPKESKSEKARPSEGRVD